MAKFLCKVTDVFKFSDERLVILTDVRFENFDPDYKWRALVKLKRPDGSELRADSSYMYVTPTNFGKHVSLSLGKTLSKADVPVGTEVWLADES